MLATFCNTVIEKICVMPRVFYKGDGMFVSITTDEPECEGGVSTIRESLQVAMVEEKIMFDLDYSAANLQNVILNHSVQWVDTGNDYLPNTLLSVSDLGQIPAYMLLRSNGTGQFRFDVTDLDETKFNVLADTFLAYYPHILAKPGVTPKSFAEHEFGNTTYHKIMSPVGYVEVENETSFVLRWDEVTFEKTRYVLSGKWSECVQVDTQEDPRIGLLQMGKILACTLDQELNTCTFYDHSKNLDDIIDVLKAGYSRFVKYNPPAKRAKTSGDE
jgi:hypothetical protein